MEAISAYIRGNGTSPDMFADMVKRMTEWSRSSASRDTMADAFSNVVVAALRTKQEECNVPLLLALTDPEGSILRSSAPREKPCDIIEFRHRVRCSFEGEMAAVTLCSEDPWFADSCLGIHSVRIVDIVQANGEPANFAHITNAQIVSGARAVESAELDNRARSSLFASLLGCSGEHRAVELPFASSYDPDRFWLPLPRKNPKCYELQLRARSAESAAAIESLEVEFTCMLFRGKSAPAVRPRFTIPHVYQATMTRYELQPRSDFIDVALTPVWLRGCSGVAVRGDTNNTFVHDLEGATLLFKVDGRTEQLLGWKSCQGRTGWGRKLGVMFDNYATLSRAHLFEFGPFMADPQRAVTFNGEALSRGQFVLRVRCKANNSQKEAVICHLDVYYIGHTSYTASETRIDCFV